MYYPNNIMHYSDIRRYITHSWLCALTLCAGWLKSLKPRLPPPLLHSNSPANWIRISTLYKWALRPILSKGMPNLGVDFGGREVIYFCGFCKLFRFGLIVACFFGLYCKAECVAKLFALLVPIKLMKYGDGSVE